ncbi:glucose-6-phosphate isomerase family protein [Rahnella woolbedingensis]|uniref:glucose-6-phosphate isomerase n=1 Tax=Rahnella woolbedingensis TaxID=1510574 RepID=A0A419NAM2_9GAMM|nr:glucose-6-phosphate isomerase [Rahnella woolbedingensis]
MTASSGLPVRVDLLTGHFDAINVQHKSTCMRDLQGVFSDDAARKALPEDFEVYHVEMLASPQQEGELHTGTTHLMPGKVADEFFMTRGHFHQRREQAEFYFGLRGEGILLLQPENAPAYTEQVFAGSVHHIPSFTAHRLVNTGHDVLSALAVWPVIAGHDYQSLQPDGFRIRVFDRDGKVSLEVAGV